LVKVRAIKNDVVFDNVVNVKKCLSFEDNIIQRHFARIYHHFAQKLLWATPGLMLWTIQSKAVCWESFERGLYPGNEYVRSPLKWS
jgi:hypothetical protein